MAGREGLDLSFSGLKTALRTRLADGTHDLPDLAASYQAAIVASLVTRTERALDRTGAARLGVVGGVAANTALRSSLETLRTRRGVELRCAPLALCGDNAAMIGAAAEHLEIREFPDYLAIDAHPRSAVMAH
jgi:N6-L-threonylcarbamoyladenine synthase